MQHFDGACLSPNSVRNAVWHALNELVCHYLRTRNPRCSTVYIENSLGPLARDSPCILMSFVHEVYSLYPICYFLLHVCQDLNQLFFGKFCYKFVVDNTFNCLLNYSSLFLLHKHGNDL